jgi:hypothetical protein
VGIGVGAGERVGMGCRDGVAAIATRDGAGLADGAADGDGLGSAAAAVAAARSSSRPPARDARAATRRRILAMGIDPRSV